MSSLLLLLATRRRAGWLAGWCALNRRLLLYLLSLNTCGGACRLASWSTLLLLLLSLDLRRLTDALALLVALLVAVLRVLLLTRLLTGVHALTALVLVVRLVLLWLHLLGLNRLLLLLLTGRLTVLLTDRLALLGGLTGSRALSIAGIKALLALVLVIVRLVHLRGSLRVGDWRHGAAWQIAGRVVHLLGELVVGQAACLAGLLAGRLVLLRLTRHVTLLSALLLRLLLLNRLELHRLIARRLTGAGAGLLALSDRLLLLNTRVDTR